MEPRYKQISRSIDFFRLNEEKIILDMWWGEVTITIVRNHQPAAVSCLVDSNHSLSILQAPRGCSTMEDELLTESPGHRAVW